MTRYRVEKTFIPSMGSIDAFDVNESYGETKEECALWHLNSMRRHDGLREWIQCPVKLTYTRIMEV